MIAFRCKLLDTPEAIRLGLVSVAAVDDDPGRVRPGANTSGAIFHSYLTYGPRWGNTTAAERDAFARRLPFRRNGAPEPGIDGYLADDRTYSAGGRALSRASLRSGG